MDAINFGHPTADTELTPDLLQKKFEDRDAWKTLESCHNREFYKDIGFDHSARKALQYLDLVDTEADELNDKHVLIIYIFTLSDVIQIEPSDLLDDIFRLLKHTLQEIATWDGLIKRMFEVMPGKPPAVIFPFQKVMIATCEFLYQYVTVVDGCRLDEVPIQDYDAYSEINKTFMHMQSEIKNTESRPIFDALHNGQDVPEPPDEPEPPMQRDVQTVERWLDVLDQYSKDIDRDEIWLDSLHPKIQIDFEQLYKSYVELKSSLSDSLSSASTEIINSLNAIQHSKNKQEKLTTKAQDVMAYWTKISVKLDQKINFHYNQDLLLNDRELLLDKLDGSLALVDKLMDTDMFKKLVQKENELNERLEKFKTNRIRVLVRFIASLCRDKI